MRKFYALLAEWYAQQRVLDIRAYRMMQPWYKEPPDPSLLFPLLGTNANEVDEEAAFEDDFANFQQVTAALTGYGR